MRSRYQLITKRDIRHCKFCGGDIAWMQYASGRWYAADVQFERDRGHFVVAGSGNHFNLKTAHDCRGHARRLADNLRRQVAEYTTKLNEAREGLRQEEIWRAAGGIVEDQAARNLCERITADWKATVAVMPAAIEKLEAEIQQHETLANKQ